MMRCPSCAAPLSRTVVGGVEVDGCNSCGGLWLDEGELQTLGNHPRSLLDAAKSFRKGALPSLGVTPTRSCPRDNEGLQKFQYQSLRGITLDRCPRCRGVFLDHGEALLIDQRLLV